MQRFSAVTEERPDLIRRAFYVWQRCAPALLCSAGKFSSSIGSIT
jgi:hypothetical protein